MRRIASVLWAVLMAGCVIMGSLLLRLFLPSFENTRALVDPLAKDGSLDLFSPALYSSVRLPAIALGILFLLLAVGLLAFRRPSLQIIKKILSAPARFVQDSRQLWRDFTTYDLSRCDLYWLIALTVLALIFRVAFIMRPLEHDEAYTVSVFATEPLRYALADYHLPNNHLFHTILVRLMVLVFGYQPWAVRLPAMLAGVLMIPALYLLAHRLYDRRVARLAAAGAAALPVLVYFGTNARGYTLVMLFTLLILLLAIYVRRRANMAGWVLLVVFSVLGLYTIPVFLFPYGVVMLWLLFAVRTGKSGEGYSSFGHFLAWFVSSGLATGLLTLLAYLPIIVKSGIRILIAEDVKYPKDWSIFLVDVHSRLQETWAQWTMELPAWVVALLVVGVILSLLLIARSRSRRVSRLPLQIVAVGWISLIVFGLKAPPWARFLSFLIPLLLLWSFAGWISLLDWIQEKVSTRYHLAAGFSVLVLAVVLLGAGIRIAVHSEARFGYKGSEESAALFLKANLQPQDLIVATSPQDAVLWYYSRYYAIDMQHYKRELPFFRAFVLVDPAVGQDLLSVMKSRGPELAFFDLSQAKAVYQSGSLQVIELVPDADMIRKAYHLSE